ncbi:MAG: hypothetical protein R3E83_24295 [Burkholderiaceae bacterium]
MLAGLSVAGLLTACIGIPGAPFHAAESKAELEGAMRAGDMDRAIDLIDANDDVLDDKVALDVAIRAGLVDAVRYFANRVDINEPLDPDGTTDLIRAVSSTPRAELDDVVAVLLEAGADPRRKDNFGRSAIDYAGFGGDLSLVRFLETGGSTFYRSDRPVRVAWVPNQDWRNIEAMSRPSGSARVLRQSPLRRVGGRPDLLLDSAWVPRTRPTDIGPYSALSFNVDGSGQVLSYYPREKRLGPSVGAALAWKYTGGRLSFAVVSLDFAAFCESASAAPGRFGVACKDYAVFGADQVGAASSEPGELARAMLAQDERRGRLASVGTTQAVFESAASICRPKQAPASERAGLPVAAASARSAGGWVVFDVRRRLAYGAAKAAVCTQREARSAAFRECAVAGGSCRSVGGCPAGQAAAVASVDGYRWAVLGCGQDLDQAKENALQVCRERAGCECQVLYGSADGDIATPAAGCSRRGG